MKYKSIPASAVEHLPHAWVVRDGATSDIEVRGPSDDWMHEPLYCVDCPVGIKDGMNPSQMFDHTVLVHEARGDIIWDHWRGLVQSMHDSYRNRMARVERKRKKPVA